MTKTKLDVREKIMLGVGTVIAVGLLAFFGNSLLNAVAQLSANASPFTIRIIDPTDPNVARYDTVKKKVTYIEYDSSYVLRASVNTKVYVEYTWYLQKAGEPELIIGHDSSVDLSKLFAGEYKIVVEGKSKGVSRYAKIEKNYIVKYFSNGCSTDYQQGDVNIDGLVDYADTVVVNSLRQSFMDSFPSLLEISSYGINTCSDINYDGFIDINDVNKLAACIKSKNCAKWPQPGGNRPVVIEKPINYSLCKELDPKLNNKADTSRKNLVFVGFNFDQKDTFINLAKAVVNGLYNFNIFKTFKDKINFWYIDEKGVILTNGLTQFQVGDQAKRVGSYKSCSNLSNVHFITLTISKDKRSFGDGYSYIGGDAFIINQTATFPIVWTLVTIHELGHALGSLDDEYAFSNEYPQEYKKIEEISNCATADANTACSKWCKGKPLNVNDLSNINCQAKNNAQCLASQKSEQPCFWYKGTNPEIKQTGCINSVQLCRSFTLKDSCLNSGFCGWIEGDKHPYFQSNCVPGLSTFYVKEESFAANFNIGTQCAAGTGCYPGCTDIMHFRQTKYGIMRSGLNPANLKFNQINLDFFTNFFTVVKSLTIKTSGAIKSDKFDLKTGAVIPQ